MKHYVIEFVFSAVCFSVLWGMAMWFAQWKKAGFSSRKATCISLITGLLYASGFLLLRYVRHHF
ncbi:DUF6404 family protein [Pantoea cypripedii]|uniref:DUF6404 family protein n=1 Tax=Pantoea cypripedii TaxID=55209 RepID=UPI0039F1C76F